MKMNIRLCTLKTAAAAIVLSFASVQVLAADIAEGEKKSATCAACHGKDGKTPIDPSYPKLAGQYKDFLVRALKDYKSGARKNAVMSGQAAALSSNDMDNLAAYYASLPSGLSTMK
jgi:cytochrome c553